MALKPTVGELLQEPSAEQRFAAIPTVPDRPAPDTRYAGFFAQTSQYIAQGTHQSLAKYFGIADKMGFTDALTEPEFNALKGQRQMTYRPGFSRQTWDNEIDAFDIGDTLSRLEQNGMDNTFSMVVGSILGGFTDPVNVAGTYLAPMIGAMAVGANALSRGAVAAAIRKGGPEAVIKFLAANPQGYFQQVKRAAIFGGLEGAAEIPADKYLSELTGQRTYTAVDAGFNILTGAALNATLTGIDPAVKTVLGAAQKQMAKLNRDTNAFAVQVATKGLNDGTPISVDEVEANLAKMETYQAGSKKPPVRTDGVKATVPERAAPTPKSVKLVVPEATRSSGTPLNFKGDDVSQALYHVANGNKDVEDQLMRALIDNGTFHADVESNREALRKAAGEIKTKVDAQVPAARADSPARLPKDLQGAKPRYQSFETRFESDVDKALFVVSQTKKSKRDADYRAFLTEQGLSDAEIEAGGARVRAALKEAAGANEGASLLDIPTLHEGKATVAPAVVPTKPVSIKTDGVPTLARLRESVVPQMHQPWGQLRGQAMYDHLQGIADRLFVNVKKVNTRAKSIVASDGKTVKVPHLTEGPYKGMLPEFVFAHEIGHTLTIRSEDGTNIANLTNEEFKQISNWKELESISVRTFDVESEALGRATTKKEKAYLLKPREVAANAVAEVLLGNQPFSILMPLKAAGYFNDLTPELLMPAAVAHTVRPSEIDLAMGTQDHKAVSTAAFSQDSVRMVEDMQKYTDATPEEIQADVAKADRLAKMFEPLGACPREIPI